MRFLYMCVLGMSLAGIVGCGGSSGSKVKGKLVDDGKAVSVSEKGLIFVDFIPTGSKATDKYGADVSTDGTFETYKVVPPGEYHVSVKVEDPHPLPENPKPSKYTKYNAAFKDDITPIKVSVESGKEVTIDLAKWLGKPR